MLVHVVDSEIAFRDTISGEYKLSELLAGSGGLTTETHRALDQLVHNIVEDNYYEITYSGNQLINETWYTDSGKTLKIKESDYTYTGNQVTQAVTYQYDGAGDVEETFIEYFNYTGSNLDSSSGVLS